jgi:hypothetical protein
MAAGRCELRALPLLVLLLAGCASAGTSDVAPENSGLATSSFGGTGGLTADLELRNEASVSEGRVAPRVREVWAMMPEVFERLGIEIDMADPQTASLGNSGFRTRRIEGRQLSRYLDCGAGLAGPYADTYEVTASLLVQLFAAPEGGTVIRSVLDAYARARDVRSSAIHCQSRGELERRIWALVEEIAAR